MFTLPALTRRLLGTAVCATVLGTVLVAAPASAAPIGLAIERTADGHGPFTPDQVPGGDTGPGNGIVRTFDAITYRVSVSANGGADTATTARVDAPAHTSWDALPERCSGPASTIAGRTLACDLGRIGGSVVAFPVTLRVGGAAQQGDQIAVTATATGAGAESPAPVTSPVTTVSAAARYDLSKRAAGTDVKTGVVGPDGSTPGILMTYPITVAADPIVSGQGLLGSERLTGDLRFTDDVSKVSRDRAVLFAPGGAACGVNTGQFGNLPGGRGGGPRNVLDSGTITCTQTAAGDPVSIVVSGTDTAVTPETIPQQSFSGGPINGGVKPYVVSGWISLWVPQPAGSATIVSTNTFSALRATSASGQPNYGAAGEPLGNNSAENSIGAFVPGSGYKSYSRVRADGSTDHRSGKGGDAYVTPGQLLRTTVNLQNPGQGPYSGAVACDVWDSRYQHLAVGPNGTHAWSQYWPAGARVEYAARPWTSITDARNATCGAGDGPWYASPDQVPGGSDAVGAVRVIGDLGAHAQANLFVYLRLDAAIANGTKVRNWGQLSFGQGPWKHDSASADAANGSLADYMIVTGTLARVEKKVIDVGYSADDTPDRTSSISAGNAVDYALYPTLTNALDGAAAQTLTIRDTLPAGTTYVPHSASIDPFRIRIVEDEDGVQHERITWQLHDVAPNQRLEPIHYTAVVSADSPEGEIVNRVEVNAPDDVSTADLRMAQRGLRVVRNGGVRVEKHAVEPTVVLGDDLVWTLDVANLDADPVTGIDVIDILPTSGDAAESSFSGAVRLKGTGAVDAAPGDVVRYTTSSAVDIDPGAGSNAPGGGTRWCTATQFGAAGCPASPSDSTAVRITRGTALAPGDATSWTLHLVGDGLHDGDRVINRYGLRAANLALPVESNPAWITVVAGSIGDTVWSDTNGDGLQSDREPGVPGVGVRLDGTDDRGTAVSSSTRTDADGKYRFADLRPGTYRVTVERPTGTAFTTEHVGTDRTVDSDVDASGVSDPVRLERIELGGGPFRVTHDSDVDAGLVAASGPEDPDLGPGPGGPGGPGDGPGNGNGGPGDGPGGPGNGGSGGPGTGIGTGIGAGGSSTGAGTHRSAGARGALAFTGTEGLLGGVVLGGLLLALGVVARVRRRSRR